MVHLVVHLVVRLVVRLEQLVVHLVVRLGCVPDALQHYTRDLTLNVSANSEVMDADVPKQFVAAL